MSQQQEKEPAVDRCQAKGECAEMFHVKRALSIGSSEIAAIKLQLEENTRLTQQIATNINTNAESVLELIAVLKGAKTGINIINRIGRGAIWIGRQSPWLIPLGGLIYFLKTGHLPPKD